MEIRKLTKEDLEPVTALYVKAMAESGYIKGLFRLRRGADAETLFARLYTEHGPMVEKAVAYGLSTGAWEAGRLVGIQVGFWYDVVRQHDAKLFGAAFRDGNGNIIEEQGLHGRLRKLPGAVLYDIAACTEPGYESVAPRLVGAARMRLRPDWVACAVHDIKDMEIYAGPDMEPYKLDDGRILCLVRC